MRRSLPRTKSIKSRSRARVALAIVLVVILLGIALPASGAPPTVQGKQQQADAIIAEINSLDSNLNRAVEAYDGARLHLAQTQRAIRSNTFVLKVAKHNLKKARENVAERLVALYEQGGQQSTIEVILGAKSLDDVINGIDAAQRVTAQDAAIARQTGVFRREVIARQRSLIEGRKRATRLVTEAAAKRSAIESSIRERQRLLASVKDEIGRMQAAERSRQLLIAQQVRARLAEQARAQARANATTSAETTATPFDQSPTSTTTGPSQPQQPATTAPPARYGGVVAIAMRYLGVPYVWGGASPSTGFDCSGFTMYVYAQIGVSLPHYTGDQWQMGTAVARDQLQPGDLVFFDGLGHEGIYIGNNQFIHAPHTGDVVKISSISGWYADTYVGARRL